MLISISDSILLIMSATNILSKIVIVLVSGLLLSGYSLGQCTVSNALSGSLFSTQSLAGSSYNWNNPGNMAASDNSRATATAIISVLSGTTNYLKATGFGFAIPSGSGICGIKAEIEKSGSNLGLLSFIQDYEIRLIKNGNIVGENKATNTNWTSAESYYTYGDISDTWGTTWTPADINAENFGIAIAARLGGIVTLLPTARIDHIRLTVYFNIVLPVTISSFSTTQAGNAVQLQWQAPEAENETEFTIQRSADGSNWTSLSGKIIHDQNVNQFRYTDEPPYPISYYRIKVRAKDGAVHYSEIRKSQLSPLNGITIYPNPATKMIQIQSREKSFIRIYNQAGQQVLATHLLPTNNSIDISGLKPGLYFIMSNDNKLKGRFQKTGN